MYTRKRYRICFTQYKTQLIFYFYGFFTFNSYFRTFNKHYRSWLKESERGIICGDFNNSVIWDKSNKESNFKETNESLNTLGYQSAYHKLTNEEFGKEKQGTLYHTKNKDKPYHIDYVFLKGIEPETIAIGSYEDWISLSDHVPVTVITTI